ncbi:hypothetical protein GYN67_06080 [Lactococcus piscium]|uniref:hypothetical protein n=1 Tax=Pseudolactococcus carnosus TaxID=2749961 RepID=UPI001FBA26EA|nr:hypothetical protein [Lactococcus carnosus]MCJ1996251.1 hypothetical protein [Lactococcus carnosus]
MEKVIHKSVKLIVIVLGVLTFLWTVYSFNYLIDIVAYLKFNFSTVMILTIGVGCYILSKIFKINNFAFLYHYKYRIMVILLLVQILFIFLTSAQAGADTTGVFESVQGISSPEYFSAFTNNYLYGLYVKGIISVFGVSYAILVQEIINILLLDIVILIVPAALSRYISEQAAYKSFLFLLLTLGINPTIISTYTDYLSIFTASLIFCFCLKFVNTKLKLYESLLFGMIFSIGVQIRVTSFIFIIGLAVVEILNLFMNKSNIRKLSYYKLLSIVIIIIGFAIPTMLANFAKANQVVHYTSGQTKPLLYFLDLGLTSTGSNHFELPAEVLQYGPSTEKINKIVKNDLKKRLSHYDIKMALYKFQKGYEAGDFGWQAERVVDEKKLVRNNMTREFIDSKFGKFIRKNIFPIDQTYLTYELLLQITYIVVIMESLLALINIAFTDLERDKTAMYILITLLGMFLYFGLFEFGRSRYLLSFWPMIVSVSTIPYLKMKNRGSRLELKVG